MAASKASITKPSGRAQAARRTQAERTLAMRARVLQGAIKVLSEQGYAGFRTAEVALAAGISRGALTHHFPTRDALVLAALEHVFRSAAELGRAHAHKVHSVDEAIKALLKDSRDFFFSELFLIAIDLSISGGKNSQDGQRIREISRAHRLPVEAAWLDALIELGVPKTLAEDLLWLTISIVRGFAVRRILADEPRRFKRLLSLWQEMVQVYLKSRSIC
jgi:AcrR family transcriptional regulator